MMTKVNQSKDVVIQFTEEQAEKLDLKIGDKIDWTLEDDAIVGRRRVEYEVDFNEFPKDVLIYFIKKSIEQDVSVEDVFHDVLQSVTKYWGDHGDSNDEPEVKETPATLSPGDRVLHEPTGREGTLENGFDPYDPSLLRVFFDNSVEEEMVKMQELVKI